MGGMQLELQNPQDRLKRGRGAFAFARKEFVNWVWRNACRLNELVGRPAAPLQLFVDCFSNHRLLRKFVASPIKYVRVSRADNPEPAVVAKHHPVGLVAAVGKAQGVGKANKGVWFVSQVQARLDLFRISHVHIVA